MAEHTIKYTHSSRGDDGPSEWAQCKCGANSGWRTTRQQAEDWATTHQQSIQRVLASLRRGTVGLARERDYYREKAQEHGLSPEERQLWQQLSDELDQRLNEGGKDVGQDSLW
jgi:hypothetical protein